MRPSRAQMGVALLVVVVVTLLCALLVLAGAQLVRLSEMLAGHDGEAARGFEAAEALLQDAELDVLGLGFQGQACQKDAAKSGCRHPATTTTMPRTLADFSLLAQQLALRDPPCADGLCLNLGGAVTAESGHGFWSDERTLGRFVTAGGGVPFGRYSGAVQAVGAGNPLLQVGSGRGAWYWIEVLPFNVGGAATGTEQAVWSPPPSDPFIFRITAVVQGRRAGGTTVLQSLLVRQVLGSP